MLVRVYQETRSPRPAGEEDEASSNIRCEHSLRRTPEKRVPEKRGCRSAREADSGENGGITKRLFSELSTRDMPNVDRRRADLGNRKVLVCVGNVRGLEIAALGAVKRRVHEGSIVARSPARWRADA